LIIGTNVSEAFIPFEVCHGFAVPGRTGDRLKRQNYNVRYIHAAADDIFFKDQVELFWKSKSLGTNVHYKSMVTDNRSAERIVSDTIAEVDGHYCVGLLWRQAEVNQSFISTTRWLKHNCVVWNLMNSCMICTISHQ